MPEIKTILGIPWRDGPEPGSIVASDDGSLTAAAEDDDIRSYIIAAVNVCATAGFTIPELRSADVAVLFQAARNTLTTQCCAKCRYLGEGSLN